MTPSLAKYHARSPRYILQPQDNTLIRIAGPLQSPWEESTEIRNISLSGLVFTASTELCPIVSEIIKIEFQIPGSRRMACYGLVTRLEPLKLTEMLVGIQFVKIDMPHRVALLQGLAQKLKDQQQKQARAEMQKIANILGRHWIAAVGLLAILGFWIMIFVVNSHNELPSEAHQFIKSLFK